jgi:hypothetical protein
MASVDWVDDSCHWGDVLKNRYSGYSKFQTEHIANYPNKLFCEVDALLIPSMDGAGNFERTFTHADKPAFEDRE